jgi:hypothetical protein
VQNANGVAAPNCSRSYSLSGALQLTKVFDALSRAECGVSKLIGNAATQSLGTPSYAIDSKH